MDAGRAWRTAKGWDKGRTKPQPARCPRLFLACTRHHRDPTGKGEEMLVTLTSCFPGGRRRGASLRVRIPHLPRSRRSRSCCWGGESGGGRRRGGGEERCAAGRAAQPVLLRGHIPRCPPRPPRVGSGHRSRSSASARGRQSSPGGARPTKGDAMFPYGKAGGVAQLGGAMFPYGEAWRGGSVPAEGGRAGGGAAPGRARAGRRHVPVRKGGCRRRALPQTRLGQSRRRYTRVGGSAASEK